MSIEQRSDKSRSLGARIDRAIDGVTRFITTKIYSAPEEVVDKYLKTDTNEPPFDPERLKEWHRLRSGRHQKKQGDR